MSGNQRFCLALSVLLLIGVALFRLSSAPIGGRGRGTQVIDLTPSNQTSPHVQAVYDFDRDTVTLIELYSSTGSAPQINVLSKASLNGGPAQP